MWLLLSLLIVATRCIRMPRKRFVEMGFVSRLARSRSARAFHSNYTRAVDPKKKLVEVILRFSRDGFINDSEREELVLIWQRFDPYFWRVPDVTEELNLNFVQQRKQFRSRLWFIPFLPYLVCWPFEVDEDDVLHLLKSMEVPEDRRVRILHLDLGYWIAQLIHFGKAGHGAVVRGRFWMRALLNLLGDFQWKQFSSGCFRAFVVYITMLAAYHFRKMVTTLSAFQLYNSRVATEDKIGLRDLKYAFVHGQIFTPAGSLRRKVRRVWGIICEELFKAKIVLLLIGWIVLGRCLEAYRDVMLPRVALVTCQVHLSLVREGLLSQADLVY